MSIARPFRSLSCFLAERGWRLRLHAGAAPSAVVAAARRAARAALATPGEAMAGFAILRPAEGGWALLVHTWRGAELLRKAPSLLPESKVPPRRCPSLARSLGTVLDLLLLAREAAARVRRGGDGDGDAYLSETLS